MLDIELWDHGIDEIRTRNWFQDENKFTHRCSDTLETILTLQNRFSLSDFSRNFQNVSINPRMIWLFSVIEMTSQCIGTSKLINTLVSGRNTNSYHRYDGRIDQYSPQSDFSDGAATTWYFREVCSSQHPIKISGTIQATFFREKKNWIHANSFTELGDRSCERGSACWGGSPSSNPAAYSQLDEMPHLLLPPKSG